MESHASTPKKYGKIASIVEGLIGRKIDFNNRDDWRVYQNAYRSSDIEGSRKAERDRYARNKQAYRNRKKAWKIKNRDKVAAIKSARRALEYGQTHPGVNRNRIKQIFQLARNTTKETAEPHCVDHIIPLKRGGWHHHLNLQVLPKRINCTSEKGVNPFWISRNPKYKDWRSVPRFLWPKDLVNKYLNLIDLYQEQDISRELLSA